MDVVKRFDSLLDRLENTIRTVAPDQDIGHGYICPSCKNLMDTGNLKVYRTYKPTENGRIRIVICQKCSARILTEEKILSVVKGPKG